MTALPFHLTGNQLQCCCIYPAGTNMCLYRGTLSSAMGTPMFTHLITMCSFPCNYLRRDTSPCVSAGWEHGPQLKGFHRPPTAAHSSDLEMSAAQTLIPVAAEEHLLPAHGLLPRLNLWKLLKLQTGLSENHI